MGSVRIYKRCLKKRHLNKSGRRQRHRAIRKDQSIDNVLQLLRNKISGAFHSTRELQDVFAKRFRNGFCPGNRIKIIGFDLVPDSDENVQVVVRVWQKNRGKRWSRVESVPMQLSSFSKK